MAIMMAQQKSDSIYVYNEKNQLIWRESGELQGYTSSTVTIKKGKELYIYNEKHQIQCTKWC